MKTVFTICTILLSVSLFAQKPISFETELLRSPKSHTHDYKKYFKKADTEVKMTYSGLFFVYKSFISSQDGSTCSFTPSCSEYAVQAVEKLGMLKGTLKFFDRYSRCNSLSPALYKVDKKKQKLVDEVGTF